jgi:hypothetical protein
VLSGFAAIPQSRFMIFRRFAKPLVVGALTISAGIAGWLSDPDSGAASSIRSTGHIPRNAPSDSSSASKPSSRKSQAEHPDPAAFSKRAAFDRLFAGRPLLHDSLTNDPRFILALYAELQDLDSSQFPFAIADALRRPGYQSEIAGWIASYWAERDLPAARAWLMTATVGSGIFEDAILEPWGRTDAAGMLDWLKAHASEIPAARKEEMSKVIAELGMERDPKRTQEVLSALGSDCRWAYHYWAMNSPEAASAAAFEEKDEARRKVAVFSAISGWIDRGRDPAPAIAWAEKLPDPQLANEALFQIGNYFLTRNKAAAARILAGLEQTNDVRNALLDAISDWRDRDWNSAARWAIQVGNDGTSRWLLSKFAGANSEQRMNEVIQSLPEEKRDAALQRWTSVPAPKPAPKPTVPPPAR